MGIDATKTLTIEAKDPHNSFLQAFIEGGVIGGGAFLLLLGLATIAGVRVWRMAKADVFDYQTSLVAAGCIAGLFSVAAQLITENVLFNTIIWWYANIALAFLATLTWSRRRTAAASEPRLDLPELAQAQEPDVSEFESTNTSTDVAGTAPSTNATARDTNRSPNSTNTGVHS